ncbi:protein-disulfide reductase DsbD domain-containing protein [Aegicerativicinus sediminis]|uniref:protein-disulfide reductase DsbD domain-containing protein n=1 Tax=Aegicerativicinus sediminis TaxID=2893202 RepID=UPI001E42C785|nr:protein-disulfide reductase DsbD domain-containing protein [Aegicerativicinus sediminis]
MKRVILILMLVATPKLFAQIYDPVSWSFNATKTGSNTYEIIATATLEGEWHIYSQFTDHNGPIPTEFVFETPTNLNLLGATIENGELHEKFEEVFDANTKYFETKVDFVQKIKITDIQQPITGYVYYMVCNNESCLPPKEVAFNIKLPK